MKKIVKVCLAALGFALSSFALLLFAPPAYSQEHLVFDPQENPRKDIEVELGCGAVYSLSLGEYRLRPHEYSFSSGTLTIYKSFLLGLSPGPHSFLAQTDEGEACFEVEVIRGKAASLKDDFGEQGSRGWEYLYYAGAPDFFDIKKLWQYYSDLERLDESYLSEGKITAWRNTYLGLTIAEKEIVMNIDRSGNRFVAIRWTPQQSGNFAVEYSLTDRAGKKGTIAFYRDSELLFWDFFSNQTSMSGSLSVEMNAGQSLYIAFLNSWNERLYWEVAIEVCSQPYAVEFIDGEQTYTQYVYPSQLAEYFEPQRENCNFLGWFLDEELTFSYDFGAPVCSDLTLYAGREQKFDFDARLEEGMIDIEVQGSPLSQYQVWIRSALEGREPSASWHWEMVRPFSGELNLSFTASERYFFDGTCYIIVREKRDGLIKDLLKSFSLGGSGITKIEIDGSPLTGGMGVVQKPNHFTISIGGGPFSQYTLKVDGMLWQTGEDGEFTLDSSGFSRGTHVFCVEVSQGESRHSTQFSIYFYEEYDASKTPVILSLEGETDTGGLSEFMMKIAFADGSDIPSEQAGGLDVSLQLEGKSARLVEFYNDGEGILTALFRHSFSGHGIYRAVGKAAPKGEGATDTIIVYYSGFSRPAFLEQEASSYEAQVGNAICISASGWIEGEEDGYLYAFYREDASGWSLMRDYSPSNVLEWTPSMAGRYNIQCRIKGVGEGSYEKSVTKTYTVTAHPLEGAISLKVIDLISGEEVTGSRLIAGRPYLFKAEAESEDALFMYTLTTKNLGTVYLDKYSPLGTLVFIPGKNDCLTITLRAINWKNFSYKDVDLKLPVESVV